MIGRGVNVEHRDYAYIVTYRGNKIGHTFGHADGAYTCAAWLATALDELVKTIVDELIEEDVNVQTTE